MRSGGTRWLAPCRLATPSMVMVLVPAPSILAPMAASSRARSPTLRLHGAVFQYRGALGQGGGHQQVFGGGHRGHVKGEVGALQALALALI